MVRHADRTAETWSESLWIRSDSQPHEAPNTRRARWDPRLPEEPRDERPAVSLARRLERDRSLVGRAAYRLFIKGWICVFVFSGLLLLGLIGGALGR
jgi:hypothetical protein